MNTIFIDGQEGTTGLQIADRLQGRSDLELLSIDPDKRKDTNERQKLLNSADVAILCLPDAAARQAVELVTNPHTRIIDSSTAHRTAEGWVYGLPEIKGQRDMIRDATRLSNPGCYATGFILLVRPLVDAGIIPADYPVVTNAITGYSGGGKPMIAAYRNIQAERKEEIACRPKNLDLVHKHLPEMTKMTGLANTPHFVPIVGDFYKGILAFVPIVPQLLHMPVAPEDIHQELFEYYRDELFVEVMPMNSEAQFEDGFLAPTGCNDTNRVEIFVFGNDERILVVSRLDNLGKGASGAAVQNMNIMLGLDEATGLPGVKHQQ